MSKKDASPPNLLIIFGGTGDLSRRKLLPALGRLAAAGRLAESTQLLGVARDASHDDASFRKLAHESMVAAGLSEDDAKAFAARCQYQTISKGGEAEYKTLAERIVAIEGQHGLPQNRTFYLSMPPGAYAGTFEGLAGAGLSESQGSTRLVIEKPFGTDLKTAKELNKLCHKHFREEQIFRIDHYLGKETVQNLLVFRFANAMFESLWTRDRVAAVQINVCEELGVGTRAGYYDHSGALRDMIQNHLAQLLTLVAMEVPAAYSAEAIRYEKIKVLKSITPIKPEDVVFGQYAAGTVDGKEVPGYLAEKDIPPGSQTETFVAARLGIDSWRWQGVPFYLRTGKRMGGRTSTIAVRFRDVPISLFESMGAGAHDTSDILVLTLQPNEGFSLHFDVKVPGSPFKLRRIPLRFDYSQMSEHIPEAYETLLLDVIRGDQTLFVHADEVEESWRIFTPLIDNPPRPVHPYESGTWGPPEAEHLSIPERELWQPSFVRKGA
jgi:glucose-6-phosphate 1-dehydrogenase